jgi:hypothetical protein
MSDSRTPIQRGYLVLADISGYTAFLTQTELDHSHEILTDLLETILERFRTLLTVQKIEGDAIFAYTPAAHLLRGETLLELIEATYVDFRERMQNVRRHTTCTCRACESIPMLDLKFMAHFGDYVAQKIGGTRELAGEDVNIVHRLLKNHVTESTGWRAYTLITQAALDHMQLQLPAGTESSESYEHLGETRIFAVDLHARYDALLQERRVVVEKEEALLTYSQELNGPPPSVWSWMNDTDKRRLYSQNPHGLSFVPIFRPGGRTSVGATTHCVHGKDIAMRETVLDWKPFDYFTVEQDSGPLGIIRVTFLLEPVGTGKTRLTYFLTGRIRNWPASLAHLVIKLVFTRLFNYRQVVTKMKEVMDQQTVETPAEQVPPELSTALEDSAVSGLQGQSVHFP